MPKSTYPPSEVIFPSSLAYLKSRLPLNEWASTISFIRIFYRSGCVLLLMAVFLLHVKPLAADPVPVARTQGTFHGFLVLKTPDGTTLASGDLVQVAHGDRVTSRLTFHFRDGSVDDEIAIYSQHKVFRLISDHHIQEGPSFPKPLDMFIDARSGQVTSRNKGQKTTQDHLDLDPDICNGLLLPILLNLNPAHSPVRLPMVAPTSKPRLVHLVIASDSEDAISIGGIRRKATNYAIKVELGGISGVVAPLIGKQPADIHFWILGGDAPAFLREEGQFYEDGPIWRVDLVSPVFPVTK
jgi:hypothetical protein